LRAPFAACKFLSTSSFSRTSRQLQISRSLSRQWVRPSATTTTQVKTTTLKHDFVINDKSPTTQERYVPPQSGLLSLLPRSIVPYAELIRLDKPAGTYYLFLPCLFSTLLAAPLADPIAAPSTVLATSALFFTGALVMRGAGCTVNDLWDRNLDPHVSRTRLRPIARRAITPFNALVYLGGQLSLGLACLLQFPTSCFFYATPSLIFVTVYPLAKRVTNYPQFVLGLTFSWGAILGFPALGVDLLSNTPALISAACLYSSCVAWTMVYDMIYAYQDIRDDAKVGIKSIALAQQKNAKFFMSAVSSLQIGLLAGAGFAIGASPVYFIGACGGAVTTLTYMIQKVDLANVKDCAAWFRRGAWFTGGAIAAGLAGEYVIQYLNQEDLEAVS
jgi:4-hydroxybenzoate polyprenyltransferase